MCIETFKAQSALDNAVQDMVENSRKLDAFEKEMDMKVILPIRLMTSLEGKVSYLNSSMIASSKHIKDVAFMEETLYLEEYKVEGYYLIPIRLEDKIIGFIVVDADKKDIEKIKFISDLINN